MAGRLRGLHLQLRGLLRPLHFSPLLLLLLRGRPRLLPLHGRGGVLLLLRRRRLAPLLALLLLLVALVMLLLLPLLLLLHALLRLRLLQLQLERILHTHRR